MKKSNFRWVICLLLFVATAVNYLDRQVLSLTWKDFIAPEFHWTDNDYGTITAVFSIVYAICNLLAGKFIDKLGTRKGYLWAIFVWPLGAIIKRLSCNFRLSYCPLLWHGRFGILRANSFAERE